MPATDNAARFDRLVQEWGIETQQRVARAYITVVTDGHIGKYVASYLASAGFGNFRLIGNSNLAKGEHFFWAIPLKDEGQAAAYAEALPKLNPFVQVSTLKGRMNSDFMKDQSRRSDVLIDATNDPETKAWTLHTSQIYGIPAISVSCDSRAARFHAFNPKQQPCIDERIGFLMKEFAGRKQDELTAMSIAGLVDEQAKKYVLGEQDGLIQSLYYSFPARPAAKSFNKYRALVVGGGAAGNLAAYSLLRMGFEVDILDKDKKIEATNLPRTPFLIERVGEQKAPVLAERLGVVFPSRKVRGIVEEFNAGFKSGTTYAVIVDCVDNDYARGEAYKYAIEHGIPHLSIGTLFDGWNFALAVPGKTACLKDYYPGFEEQARRSEAIIRASCMQTIASNSWMQSAAAFGALQLPTALFPETAGEPFNGYFYYDAKGSDIVRVRAREVCNCWRQKR